MHILSGSTVFFIETTEEERPFYFVIPSYLPSVESRAVLPVSETECILCSSALCGVPGLI